MSYYFWQESRTISSFRLSVMFSFTETMEYVFRVSPMICQSFCSCDEVVLHRIFLGNHDFCKFSKSVDIELFPPLSYFKFLCFKTCAKLKKKQQVTTNFSHSNGLSNQCLHEKTLLYSYDFKKFLCSTPPPLDSLSWILLAICINNKTRYLHNFPMFKIYIYFDGAFVANCSSFIADSLTFTVLY